MTEGTLSLGGERITGDSVRTQNVLAAMTIANIVRTSLGPLGLDKMLVDDIGDVTITNDGATILKLLEVEHPAAKVLVELAQLQDQEVGDGTTSVVIIAAELLKNADQLVKQKIHPTSVISGYKLACKLAVKYIQDKMVIPVDELGSECLINVAKTSMASKVIGIETDIAKERVAKLLNAGANVILTTGGIDDLCLKQFVEAGAMAVRRCKKADLKRIAKATGATLLTALANMEGDESVDASIIGSADEVVQERICDDELILIRGPKARTAASIIIRGANDFMCDEIERSVHDALCVIKRVLESKQVVPGGGCCETALSIYLENFATTVSSREQLAIAEFATALLSIPKALSVNAAQDATELVAKLRAYHNASQTQKDKEQLKWFGLDLQAGKVRDCKSFGVFEPAVSKIKSLKYATEAAITILRIDDMIKLDKEEKKGRHGDECM
ncbi:unnamed protein product [Rotaria socialis]|uniref:T-complex protein 1 subunit alpha n=1 Tax=Rotaria socialis TaxID=392032 RepID=A0A820ACM4_9BILA|nr:unnamed protein product [Rotaria socialis]